jgi:predicted oxidoreductase
MGELVIPAERRPLGKSGFLVSPIAWGMWRFAGSDLGAARGRVDAALGAGITLFDTADVYGLDNAEPFGAAEALLGRLFAADPALRGRMVLAGKGGIRPPVPYDSSPAYLIEACEASLRRLGTDWFDLWQIHRPDLLTHPQDIAEAVARLFAAGKIRAFGLSNVTASQTAMLASWLDVPIVATQPELSALAPEPFLDGLADQALEMGHAILAWSPLGGGRLAAPADTRAEAVAALLDQRAAEAGVGRPAAALAWIMAHPSRPIPIIGSQQPPRIAEAARAPEVCYTRQQWYEILVAATGRPLP